jgi:hypothetical protein
MSTGAALRHRLTTGAATGRHPIKENPMTLDLGVYSFGSTTRIGLGTTVTVLSTDDPLRVFEQMATAAAIAPGRIRHSPRVLLSGRTSGPWLDVGASISPFRDGATR